MTVDSRRTESHGSCLVQARGEGQPLPERDRGIDDSRRFFEASAWVRVWITCPPETAGTTPRPRNLELGIDGMVWYSSRNDTFERKEPRQHNSL